jgi:ATP-dependent RNA helicase RhlE
MPFTTFGLCAGLRQALEAGGYLELMGIQGQALPPALAGRDVVAVAPTGSGKTVAFALPVLQRLTEAPAPERGPVRALVLVPTRELAAQVAEVFVQLGRFLPVPARIRAVFGGVSCNPQMMALRGGAEVLVATPGRLLDLAGRNAVRLSQVEILVLDEADRMLDLGFREQLERLLELLPARRQNLLFSATRSQAAGGLLRPMLRDPSELGEPGREQPPEAIAQRVYLVDQAQKGPLLRFLIQRGGWDQVLVFVASHRRADTVVRKLQNHGIHAEAMHGDLSQGARTGALAGFRAGGTRVLVATDLAARGLDLEQLPCVINYELPRSPNDYLHRVGRTGRAGAAGLALSLVAPEEVQHMRLIEKRMGQRLVHLDSADMEFLQGPPERG